MKILFWNVDTQKDFMNKNGKLYVEGVEAIKPNLKKLTQYAKEHNIKVVNTGDMHLPKDKELSDTPNFKTTFPEHCMLGSEGIEFIKETYPWEKDTYYQVTCFHDNELNIGALHLARNIIIHKNTFDVFEGNSFTDEVLEELKPDSIVIYGVSGDYCVDYAIRGLIQRKYNVIAVIDAIKSLKETPINEWNKLGVISISTTAVINFLKTTEQNEK